MYTSWGEAAAAGRVVGLLLLISGGAFRIGTLKLNYSSLLCKLHNCLAIVDAEDAVDLNYVLFDCGSAVTEAISHLVGGEIFLKEFDY